MPIAVLALLEVYWKGRRKSMQSDQGGNASHTPGHDGTIAFEQVFDFFTWFVAKF